jgi:hypothetical protein
MEFAGHCYKFLHSPGCEATLTFVSEQVWGIHRKALAARAWREVTSRFVPTFREENGATSELAAKKKTATSAALEQAA